MFMKPHCLLIRAFALLLVLLALSGCTGDKARLKRNIAIDGIDVSRMTVAEARAALSAASQARRETLRFTCLLPDGSVTLTADDLALVCDVEDAITRALHLPAGASERSFSSVWRAGQDTVGAVSKKLSETHGNPPRNAAVTVDFSLGEPFSFSPERAGVIIDAESLSKRLTEAASTGQSAAIDVPCATIAPEITLADVRADKTLISSYTTSFAKSPQNAANRVFNIQKAAAAVHGVVLAPGETFDCNATLGDRNAENGWKLAAGIRSGVYVDEYGGGVCQVSSTLFNAVMMADLTVDERHPHSWPMSYVGIGRDATISTGGKNFRFTNTTGSDLYLAAIADPSAMTLTVSLYGRPLSDGIHIEVASEQTGTLQSLPAETLLDETLPNQTRIVEREARRGKTSRTYKHYYGADGTLLRTEVAYEDVYRSISELSIVSSDIFYS